MDTRSTTFEDPHHSQVRHAHSKSLLILLLHSVRRKNPTICNLTSKQHRLRSLPCCAVLAPQTRVAVLPLRSIGARQCEGRCSVATYHRKRRKQSTEEIRKVLVDWQFAQSREMKNERIYQHSHDPVPLPFPIPDWYMLWIYSFSKKSESDIHMLGAVYECQV